MNSPARLRVSPNAASNPTGVFSQRFEALFPCTKTLSFEVCLAPQLFLLVYLHMNVGLSSPQSTTSPDPPAAALPRILSAQLPVSTPPTGQDECVFFNALVVGLPVWFSVSSGCFLFLNCCGPSFGCARRHSVSTYTSIFSFSLYIVLLHL